MADKVFVFDEDKEEKQNKKTKSEADMIKSGDTGMISDIQIEDPFVFLNASEREQYMKQMHKESMDKQAHKDFEEDERRPDREDDFEEEPEQEEESLEEDGYEDEEDSDLKEGKKKSLFDRFRRVHEESDEFEDDDDDEYDEDRQRDYSKDNEDGYADDRDYDEEDEDEEDGDDDDSPSSNKLIRIMSTLTGLLILIVIIFIVKIRVVDPIMAGNEDEQVTELSTDGGETMITTTELNLRSTPSADGSSNIIAVAPKGATVVRMSESDGWSTVIYENQTLYCASKYLTAAQ